MKRWLKTILIIIAIIPVLWLVLEIGVRIYVESPLKADFHGSIPAARIPRRQEEIGVQVVTGPGWIHLGWIANPNLETYRIEKNVNEDWQEIGQAEFGSFMVHGAGGTFRVVRMPKDGSNVGILGEVNAAAVALLEWQIQDGTP